ncbi:hypothetical protein B0H19DRAFT_1257200 [Mycena capillaripes]|nr:hypothetical protein B0H19DRAFT_1257200 [Mycena capillaripes]
MFLPFVASLSFFPSHVHVHFSLLVPVLLLFSFLLLFPFLYRNIWPFEHARVKLHRLHEKVVQRVSASPAPAPGPPVGSAQVGRGQTQTEGQGPMQGIQTQAKAQFPPRLASGSKQSSVAQSDSTRSAKRETQTQTQTQTPRKASDAAAQAQPAARMMKLPEVEEATEEEEELYDDYVNASYVQPLGTRRRYIATQGPLEATFGDFWTLVWQQNIHVIVMLTREVEGAMVKCGSYWRPGTYGPLRVELLGCAADGCRGVCPLCSGEATTEGGVGGVGAGGFFAGAATTHNPAPGHPQSPQPTPPASQQLIKRTLRLTHAAHPSAPPRRVVQLQYLGWPDMNVPEDARGVLGLVWEVGKVVEEVGREEAGRADGTSGSAPPGGSEAMEQDDDEARGSGSESSDSDVDSATGVLRRALRVGDAAAPVLLHCSAGVGRTGGFIAVDAVLDAVRQEARELYAASGAGSPVSGGARSGSDGVVGISAEMRASGISDGPRAPPPGRAEEDDRMEVDVAVEDADADAEMHEGRGMRTPMQVDNVAELQMEMRLGGSDMHMGETRRWAERVADTKALSLPSTAFPTSALGVDGSGGPASFPSSALGSPFQFQPPAHRTTFSLTLPAAHNSLPTAPSPSTHSQSPENKSASLPVNPSGGVLPLSVRRGYADYRLRTFSAPSAAQPPAPPSGPASFLHPPQPTFTHSPLLGKILSDQPLANSPLPDRPRSLSPFSAPGPPQSHIIHSFEGAEDVAQKQQEQQRGAVDYKEPRVLHGRRSARPVRLSAFEDPIWEVVQDMREQRMSLCQSLRQYVFVHAAIIEGSLMVVDEERARAGVAWRSPQSVRRGGVGPRPPRPTLFLVPSPTSSTGKRLASPTELPKEDKKGEIALSKRPSIKRKQASTDEYSYASPLPTYPPP